MQSTTTITGRLVQDPVDALNVRNDKTVAELTLAVRDHRLPDDVRFIDVSQWEDAAARAAQYLQKGRWVTAEGLLDARAYVDKNGDARVGWTLCRAHIEFGPHPIADAHTEDRDPVPAGAGADDDIPF